VVVPEIATDLEECVAFVVLPPHEQAVRTPRLEAATESLSGGANVTTTDSHSAVDDERVHRLQFHEVADPGEQGVEAVVHVSTGEEIVAE
jgi:Mg-chelatase subunit ChlI